MSIGCSSGRVPRQLDQPVEIGAHHAVFGRGFRHAFEATQLAARLFLDVLRHLGLGDGLAELGHLGALAGVALAQLLLNRGHLLAQQNLALAFVERGLGLAANLLRQPQHLDAMREQPRHLVDARADIDRLQDFLLLLGRDIHGSRREIGECAR